MVNFRVAKSDSMGKAIELGLSQVLHPDFYPGDFNINSPNCDQRFYNIHLLTIRI